ncbi:cell adhesion molecule CEACAM1-like isoform X5 [Peromyscus maniculatus bairdii]|uniref:cell adhesion molecule CEACAM1-like isoform X5 n=1 Tax=Peromyscus maniculatus bairdii TaxID=230844 RepID=UPI003FD0A2F7
MPSSGRRLRSGNKSRADTRGAQLGSILRVKSPLQRKSLGHNRDHGAHLSPSPQRTGLMEGTPAHRVQMSQEELIAKFIKSQENFQNGPAHTGRDMVYPNGSLLIQNVTHSDAGVYTLRVIVHYTDKRSSSVQFHVHQPVTIPSIQVTNNTVKDLISVFLKCLSNDTEISIHWLFKGKSLVITNRMRLSPNNRSLQIDPARNEDSGDYQCEVSNQASSKRSDPIQLDIIYPVTPPSIQVTNSTVKDLISVFLNCLSNDTGIFIHWLFKGKSLVVTNRTRLSTNNRTLQIDSVKIEDSGDYQCEVSNQVSSKRSDPIQLDIIRQPAKPKHVPSLRGIIGIVAQCLMGLIAVIFVLVFLWRSHRGREPQIENDIKQVDNEPTNPNEPSNLNKTSKEASNVKHQKKKKSKGKK